MAPPKLFRRRGPESPILGDYTGSARWVRPGTNRRIVFGVAAFCLIYGFAFAIFGEFLLPMFLIPPAILALIVLWALPQEIPAPTKLLEIFFFAFFISLVAWPDYLAIALPGLPWITLLRLTGFPMLFLLLVCISVSDQFRRDLLGSLQGAPVIWRLFLVFVAVQFCSIFLSQDKTGSLQKFVIFQVTWTTAFFCGAYVFAKPGRVRVWAGMLWAFGLYVSVIGLWENRLQHVPWFGHIPGFLKIEDPTVERMLAGSMRAGTNQYRVQATFGSSLGLSEYLALIMPFVVTFLADRYAFLVRVAAGASVLLLGWVVILTDSRLGVVGCLMTFLLYVLAFGIRVWRHRPSSLIGPAVTLAYPAAFAVVIAGTFVNMRLHRYVWGASAQQYSTRARIDQYNLGFTRLLHNPFGYGIGRAAETLNYQPFGILTIDSYYLAVALEYGLFGFLVYFSMFAVAILSVGRQAFSREDNDPDQSFLMPIAISLTNFIVIKSVFAQQDNHPMVFMMLGCVCALAYRRALQGDRSGPTRWYPVFR